MVLTDTLAVDKRIAVAGIAVVHMCMDIALGNPTAVCPILYRSLYQNLHQSLCRSLCPILYQIQTSDS